MAKGIIMIKLLKYGNTNCYYIKGKKGSVLIDTDWAGTLQLFYRKIKELGIKTIDYLLITHYHPDHMGIAQDIVDNMGTKLIVMDVQKDYIHWSDKIFAKDNRINFTPINTEPVIISCKESRKFLQNLGIDGEILHTPGHSDDSISLVLDDGVAFVGDLYNLNSAAALNDEKVDNSWKNLLSHNISKVCYGHHEQIIDKEK